MVDSLEENRRRLFVMDAGLRAEADNMLEESGLGEILREEGFGISGSYDWRVMTWHELDFERCDDNPELKQHWELGERFLWNDWVWGMRYLDASRDPRNPGDEGYYWGLDVINPHGGELWKMDLWTARPEVYEISTPKRPLWRKIINDDSRYYILLIKEVLCKLPEYRKEFHSWDIYEAVLENNVRSIDEFWAWLKLRN